MKVGRNDLCPCGSGKKYKRCCLSSDREAESAELAAAQEEAISEMQAEVEEMEEMLEEDEELDELSNSVMDLIDVGDIDEAERVARELIECYPQVHDGYDRLGMVYEARGNNKAAADCYRKVIEFVHTHADYYEPDFEVTFQKLVEKLDPTEAASPAEQIIGIYRRHAEEWVADRQRTSFSERNWLERFIALLPSAASVLDVGLSHGTVSFI